MVRKKGKLPGPTIPHSYQLEYGTDTVEVQADAVGHGQRVVVLDDLLATGGTMSAAIALLQKVGADVRAAACIIELAFLNGRSKLAVPFMRHCQVEDPRLEIPLSKLQKQTKHCPIQKQTERYESMQYKKTRCCSDLLREIQRIAQGSYLIFSQTTDTATTFS